MNAAAIAHPADSASQADCDQLVEYRSDKRAWAQVFKRRWKRQQFIQSMNIPKYCLSPERARGCTAAVPADPSNARPAFLLLPLEHCT